ncbi:MAG: TrpR-related protein YerC/YecD [Clostridia bacterium]|nr:TrpR-related protein YerC/YecD [Clostridia bacterium]
MQAKKSVSKKDIEDLFEVIIAINSVKDCRDLFEDLCTDKEIEQMAQRVKAAKLLMAGNTYNQVIEQTDISSATLCRVSRCVQYGKGYKKFVK